MKNTLLYPLQRIIFRFSLWKHLNLEGILRLVSSKNPNIFRDIIQIQ